MSLCLYDGHHHLDVWHTSFSQSVDGGQSRRHSRSQTSTNYTFNFRDWNFILLSRNYLVKVETSFMDENITLRISLCICRIFIRSPFSVLNIFILINRSGLQVNKLRSEVIKWEFYSLRAEDGAACGNTCYKACVSKQTKWTTDKMYYIKDLKYFYPKVRIKCFLTSVLGENPSCIFM